MIGTAARTSSWLVTDNSTPPECCALTMNFHSDRSRLRHWMSACWRFPDEASIEFWAYQPSLRDFRFLCKVMVKSSPRDANDPNRTL